MFEVSHVGLEQVLRLPGHAESTTDLFGEPR